MSILSLFKLFSSNKVFLYIASRYTTYFIQFINSIFIAIYLGPFYLGVWGFITLVTQYFSQLNFGIPHALNALISIHKKDNIYVERIFNTTLTITTVLIIPVLVFFLLNNYWRLNIGEQYLFGTYSIYICIIVILNYYITLFSNLFRVHNRLFEIAFSQSVFPFLMLLCILLKKGEDLLFYLVIANLMAFAISLLLFLRKNPIKIKFIYPKEIAQLIWRKSLLLFLYNSSFYLIMISTRSFISINYTVKEFGFFTFSLTMASTFLLLLESISFLIYPKIINRLASSTNEKSFEIIESLRINYIMFSHFLMHVVIAVFPFFLLFFPLYSDVKTSFILIALTFVLYTNCFGYSGLLIAKGKEGILGVASFIALLVNITCVYCLITFLNVKYHYAVLGTMISYFIYLFMIYYLGRRLLDDVKFNFSFLNGLFPINLLGPFLLSLGFTLFNFNPYCYLISLSCFVVLNWKSMILILNTVRNIIKHPDIINI